MFPTVTVSPISFHAFEQQYSTFINRAICATVHVECCVAIGTDPHISAGYESCWLYPMLMLPQFLISPRYFTVNA